MRIDVGAAASAAWALFKRDRDALLALGGMFLFLPALAMLLLLPAPPPPPAGAAEAGQQAIQLWISGYMAWLIASAPWLLMSAVMTMFGSLTILTFYLDGSRPDVGSALRTAMRHFPTYALLMTGITIVASAAVLLFVLPGLWVLGRTMLIGPALVAERGADGAPIRRSIVLTRGNNLVLTGLAGIGTFGAQLLMTPFIAMDEAMRAAHAVNPVAIVIVDIGAAAIGSTVALAMILLRVTIYRGVVGPSSGI